MALNYRIGDEPVPGFRLERFLGRGAIGEVWHASGPGGTEAALKIVDLTGGGLHGRKEFRALQMVKRIHHPNLTPIIGLWAKADDGAILDESDTVQLESSQGSPSGPLVTHTMVVPAEPGARRPSELVIAMGLGDKSLADRLTECQREGLPGIPLDELLDYLEGAGRAIDFLNRPIHSLASGTGAIVHCDIKPLNILVVGGAVQVCDFGLAHMIGAARRTAAAMGTIAYAAPELLEGKPGPGTDQYCLAITYFELRTGALPYDQESAVAVMEAVRKGELNLSKIPEPEQRVIRKATSVSMADRYASAMEMVSELRAAATGVEGKAAPRGARIPRAGRILAAASALVLLGLAGYWFWFPEPAPQPGGTSLEELVARAQSHLQSGDYRIAAEDFTSALGLGADNLAARVGRGRAYFELQDYAKAVGDLRRARELDASDPETSQLLIRAHQALADEDFRRGDLQAAVEDSGAVLALDARDITALLRRAACYVRLGDLEKAAVDLEVVLAVDPAHAQAQRLLAEVRAAQVEALLKANQPEPARSLAAKALDRSPNDRKLLVLLGRACLGLDLVDDAIGYLDAAVKADDADPEARFHRGIALTKKGDFTRAVADFEAVQKMDPANQAGYQTRREYADAYLGLGTKCGDEAKQLAAKGMTANGEAVREQLKAGVAQLTRALQYDATRALVWSRRGSMRRNLQDLPGAVEDLSRAIALGGDEVHQDLIFRGEAQLRMASRASDAASKSELLAAAKKDFEAAIAKSPGSAEAHFYLALVQSQQSDFPAAVESYTKAITEYPRSKDPGFDLPSALYARGSLRILIKQLDEAADDFTQMLKSAGEDLEDPAETAATLRELAKEFQKAGQSAKAAQWNKKADELTSKKP